MHRYYRKLALTSPQNRSVDMTSHKREIHGRFIMKKNNKTAICSLVLCMLAVFMSALAVFVMTDTVKIDAAKNNATISGFEDQIKDLESKEKDLQKEINALKNDSSATLKLRETLDKQLSVTYEKIDAANALVAELDTQTTQTALDITDMENNLAHQKEVFIQRLRLAYEESDVSYIAMLFDADGLSDFFNNIERVGALLDYDKKLMDSYSKQKTELEEKKTELDVQLEKQKEYQSSLKETELDLSIKLKEAETLLENINNNQEKYQQELAAVKAEEKKLEAELAAYIKKLQEEQNKNYMVEGQLQWPIKTNATGYNRITSRFGYRNLVVNGNDVSNHKGIDIGVRYVAVYACGPGTVITSTYSSSYGNYIVIDHGGGVSTLYAHLSKLGVKKGQEVSAGQNIGTSGNTGWSEGPHLHLELRINGAYKDPLNTKDKYNLFYLSRPSNLFYP